MKDWTEFPEQPTETGDYLVGHRGTMRVIKYLAPEKGKWFPNAKLMWQEDPRKFGATHWRKVEGPPESTHNRAMLQSLPRGAVVKFRYDRRVSLKVGDDPEHRVKKHWSWKKFGMVTEYDYWKWRERDYYIKAGETGVVIKCKRIPKTGEYGYWVQIGSGDKAGWVLFQGDDVPFDPKNPAMFYDNGARGITHSDEIGNTLLDLPYE